MIENICAHVLLRIQPTDEEKVMLKSFKGDRSTLQAADTFLLKVQIKDQYSAIVTFIVLNLSMIHNSKSMYVYFGTELVALLESLTSGTIWGSYM